MKTYQIPFLLVILAVMCTGCLYSNVRTPFDTDLDRTTLGDKQGEASMHSVLWLVAWGDAGTAAAAKEGGLTTVNHMDMEIFSILFGLYTKQKTIVYGE
jgi:hypothetical protein